MRRFLPLALACLLAVQAVSARHLLQKPDQTLGRQFVQFGVTVRGTCSEVSSLPEQINSALQADVQELLDAGYPGLNIKALIPRIDRPAFCTDVKSREPDDNANYAAIQAIVRLQTGDNPNTPPPDNVVQLQAVRLLNRGWNQCTADYADNTFSSIADALSAAGKTAVINRATRQQSGNRIRTAQLQPCVGTNPPTPPSSPSPPVSPSPPPESPSPPVSPSPPESPSPPASPSPPPGPATCGNTGGGQPFACVDPFINKPNNQNITNPSTTACCECPAASNVEAIDVSGALVNCLNPTAPCPNSFPITVRPFAGSPPVACLARGSDTVCPDGFKFPFYATVSGQTVLTNCWPDNVLASSGNTCQIAVTSGPSGTTGIYGIPMRNSATSTPVGCVLNGASSCPASHPFTQFGTSGITACLLQPTSCPGDSVPLYSDDRLVGCGQVDANGDCPDAYPIEVSTSFGSPPVQCYAPNMACSFAAAFQFSLLSGNTLVRCVRPIPGVNTCTAADFGPFDGVELYSVTASVGFMGCADTSNACPTSYPVFFRDGNDDLERCSASITGDCEQQFNGQYLTNVLNTTNGAIIGCRRGGTCGADDVIVSDTVTSDALECLPSGTTACPAGRFPLYAGAVDNLVNGVAKLVRCIDAITTTSCNDVGIFTSEVFGTSDVTGSVVACMKPTSTPCPSTSPFAILSDAGTVTSCRTGGACGTTSTRLVSGSGATIGCITPASNICPTGAATYVYNLPFFLRGFPANVAAEGMVECRAEPADPPSNCNNFADYPISVFDVSDIISTNRLTGCMRSGESCSVPGYESVLLGGVDGILQSCRSSVIFGCANDREVISGTDGSVLGCFTSEVRRCGDPNFGFSIWNNNGPNNAILLEHCATAPDFSVTPDCDTFASAIFNENADYVVDRPIEVLTSNGPVSESNWVGCTDEFPTCPAGYNIFLVGVNLGVDKCLADGVACDGDTQVPIYGSNSAAVSTPLVGCMTRANAPDDVGQSCPSDPFFDGGPEYQFPLVNSDRSLVACFRSNPGDKSCDASTTPPRQIALYQQECCDWTQTLDAELLGCMIVDSPRQATCPEGPINGQGFRNFNFELYGSNGTIGGAAVLHACVDTADDVGTVSTCSGLGTIGDVVEYPVPVNNNFLNDTLGPLSACLARDVACPSSNSFSIWEVPNPNDMVGGMLGQAILVRCIAGSGDASGPGACDGESNGGGGTTAGGIVVINRNTVPNGAAAADAPADNTFVGCVTGQSDARGCPAAYPAFLADAGGSGDVLACQKAPGSTCSSATGATDFFRQVRSGSSPVLGCTTGSDAACETWAGVNVQGWSNPFCQPNTP